MSNELKELQAAIEEIYETASRLGLDYEDMRFELCPADILYTFGSYGMPSRFSHWSFGKSFHRLKTLYDYNLNRMYEMVINTKPCYAFLLEGNSLLQHKLVVAHVLAHSDFFKHNVYMKRTNKDMMETMAVNAERIRQYEFKFGRAQVETLLDALLALQEHGDFSLWPGPEAKQEVNGKKLVSPYDDLWQLGLQEQNRETSLAKRRLPAHPEKDLLRFIGEHSPVLEEWQRDVLDMVREEIRYFWPQMQTKIINEGWATYWHLKIMRQLDLNETEAIEFGKMHAAVIQPSKFRINPYLLGLKIFQYLEQEQSTPALEQVFWARTTENDISFLRSYLTPKIIDELNLYVFQKAGVDWVIKDRRADAVKEHLIKSLFNCGIPVLFVEEADYRNRGELYLRHSYEGEELDVPYLEKTLPHVYLLWGRPVYLETVVEGKSMVFSYDGKKNFRHAGGSKALV
ncbi:MAG: SpoVR family protein [Bacillota bacterium]